MFRKLRERIVNRTNHHIVKTRCKFKFDVIWFEIEIQTLLKPST